ncbi:MAG TPA: threonine synthase [Ktedonobacteraceae bacterium]|nr:threonine synthase [Ktedonobacteraceae bacterium]
MGINSVDSDISGNAEQPGQVKGVALQDALVDLSLRCVECGALYPGSEAMPRYRCMCGGVLDVEASFSPPTHDTAQAREVAEDTSPLSGAAWRQLFDERACTSPCWSLNSGTLLADRSGVWRYRELILPVHASSIISRPEGNTGLYPVGLKNCDESRIGHRQIGVFAGLEHFFLKHEGENPTGSFKDRGMTVGVTVACLRGARAVACASTGNTSASLASYAAQAGMQAIVFLPAGQIAGGKLAQSLAYGATTIQIKGDFDAAMQLVEQVCNEMGIYLLNSLNPFRVEGQKAIGLEILQQLDWQAPDWLVLPAGNLGNTSAIGKAFRQAHQLGLISHLPRIASIQATGADPFYRSFKQQFARRERVQAHTVATAIKIGDPVSYTRARRVIEESNGLVEEVTDEEILAAKAVIDRSGIGCEPASAAALAGTKKLVEAGIIQRDERVVAVLTGHLLKDSQTGIPQNVTGQAIEPTLDAVKKALDGTR